MTGFKASINVFYTCIWGFILQNLTRNTIRWCKLFKGDYKILVIQSCNVGVCKWIGSLILNYIKVLPDQLRGTISGRIISCNLSKWRIYWISRVPNTNKCFAIKRCNTDMDNFNLELVKLSLWSYFCKTCCIRAWYLEYLAHNIILLEAYLNSPHHNNPLRI